MAGIRVTAIQQHVSSGSPLNWGAQRGFMPQVRHGAVAADDLDWRERLERATRRIMRLILEQEPSSERAAFARGVWGGRADADEYVIDRMAAMLEARALNIEIGTAVDSANDALPGLVAQIEGAARRLIVLEDAAREHAARHRDVLLMLW